MTDAPVVNLISHEEAARLIRTKGAESCKKIHAVFEDGHKRWEVLFVNSADEPFTAYIDGQSVCIGVGW